MRKKIPLVIDGQVFQTVAWDRGMGKYSLQFIKAFLENTKSHYSSVTFIFTKNLELRATIKKILEEHCGTVEFIFLDLAVPRNIPKEQIASLQDNNIHTLDQFVDAQFKCKVDFIVLALFIEQICAVFPTYARAILLFYDLIPLQYPKLYGSLWSYPTYLERFSVLFRADKILAISETVADDLSYFTGIGRDKIGCINGAQIPRRNMEACRPESLADGPYVLMPTGNDLRKNNQRAVEGFEKYRQANPSDPFRLVITSHFDEATQRSLKAMSNRVEFVGNVSEAELLWLYNNAQALLFVPEYEGLGLPVLEAVEAGMPIVCSRIRVFCDEMSNDAFYAANPYDSDDIAMMLDRALHGEGFKAKYTAYRKILDKFNWDKTAIRARTFINNSDEPSNIGAKQRLAILTPDPGGYSAIGKVTMLTHEALSRYFNIDYYVEKGRSIEYSNHQPMRPNFLPAVAHVYDILEFTALKYKEYDKVLYQVGNSEYHVETIKDALYLPGYVVLHDMMLTGVFENELHRFGHLNEARFLAEQHLNKLGGLTTSYTASLVANQLGCMVYSEYGREALSAENIASTPIAVSALPVSVRFPRAIPRMPSNKLHIGFAGIIHEAKGLGIITLLASPEYAGMFEISVFGATLTDDLVIKRLESFKNVTVEKNLTDDEFSSRLSELDVVINYRLDYRGESSLTVLESMGHGVVPIVRAVGWYNELPDDAVVKVSSEKEVISSIVSLHSNHMELLQKKQAAHRYVAENHSYEKHAEDIARFLSGNAEHTSDAQKTADMLHGGASKSDILRELSLASG